MTEKWEPAVVKQRVSDLTSFILTSRNGAEYRRNRHTVNRSELATRDNPSKEMEPIHVEEPPACVDDASYRTKAGRCVRPPKRLDL